MRFSPFTVALYMATSITALPVPETPATAQPSLPQLAQGMTKALPFLKTLLATNENLGPLIAQRNPLFATSTSDNLDLDKVVLGIKALAADAPKPAAPPASGATSTLGGITNISDAAKAAMNGDMSGAVTSGAMALAMDMPVAIASGVGSILSMEWSLLSGIGSGLGSMASAGLGMVTGKAGTV